MVTTSTDNIEKRQRKRRGGKRAAQRAATRKRRAQQRQLDSLQHQPNPYRVYRVGRLAQLLDTDRSTIWRWRKTGVLPEPEAEIGGIHGWTERQVEELLGQRGRS